MKKYLLSLLAVAVISCQKVSLYDDETAEEPATRTVTFNVNGDFGTPTFTRASLSADGREMTDLWLFDFMGDECVQSIHQYDDDDAWGEPSISLSYGVHHLYFVVSRGSDPTVDEDDHVITWATVRDTFWGHCELTVSATSDTEQSVTLGRAVAKVKINVNDIIPSNLSTLTVTPAKWYHGINYVTGEMASEDDEPISVSVPSSYAGTSGTLFLSMFTFSDDDEWTTDMTLTAQNSNNETIGSVLIQNAPFKRNRVTEYSGYLFGKSHTMDVSLDASWLTSVSGTW